MFNTMLSIVLAGAGMASGQVGYGGYASYSTYGMYASYPGRAYGPSWVLPYYVFPFVEISNASGDSSAKEHDAMDKRFSELKSILGIYEQKIRGLEQKLEEQDKSSETQAKIAEILDKKVAEALERNQANAGEQMKTLVGKLEDRLRTMEDKIQNGPAPGVGQPVSTLEQRLNFLEQQLREKGGLEDALNKNFAALGKQLGTMNGGKEPSAGRFKTGVPFNRGLIVVSLPADARLFLDNLPSAVGANLRSFISPELEVNKNYFYTVKVEVDRNGKTLTESQRVYFQPGREVRVSFDHLDNNLANAQTTSKNN